MLQGRITSEQMEWLENRAAELGGNLSAAIRQSITDARLLEMARADYKELREEQPDFQLPTHNDGSTTVLRAVVSGFIGEDAEDVKLRQLEREGKA